MVRYVARCKYMVTGGQCKEEQWESVLANYLSRGYTVTRIN